MSNSLGALGTPLEKVISQTSRQNQNCILSLMKESRIYWQARKEVIALFLKSKEKGIEPSVEEIIKLLQVSENDGKVNGLINNCLQKSTKRLPI